MVVGSRFCSTIGYNPFAFNEEETSMFREYGFDVFEVE